MANEDALDRQLQVAIEHKGQNKQLYYYDTVDYKGTKVFCSWNLPPRKGTLYYDENKKPLLGVNNG